MKPISDSQLNQWLRQAYPDLEVSPDFTVRLWRRLMKTPAPVYSRSWVALAAVVGIVAGLGSSLAATQAVTLERLDLFGNAPRETVAGTVLSLMEGKVR